MGEAGTRYLCWPEGLMAKTAISLLFLFLWKKKKNQRIHLLSFPSSLLFSWKQCYRVAGPCRGLVPCFTIHASERCPPSPSHHQSNLLHPNSRLRWFIFAWSLQCLDISVNYHLSSQQRSILEFVSSSVTQWEITTPVSMLPFPNLNGLNK